MSKASPLPAPVGVTADVLAVADRLRPVLLRINRRMRSQLDPLGISTTQVSVLAMIRDRPGIGVGELASAERMSSPSMSVHIDRLEAAGYVTRTRGEDDRRRVGLNLSAEGARVLRLVRSRRTAWLAEHLATLDPAAVAAIEAALPALGRLVDLP